MTRILLYLCICVELNQIQGYEEFDYIKSDSISEAEHKCMGSNGTLHIPKTEEIYDIDLTYENDSVWNGYLHKTPWIENMGCYRINAAVKEVRLKDCEMSVAVCLRACQRNRKREVFIGVKASECICTTKEDFHSFKEVEAGHCDNICNKVQHEMCGSTKELTLYNIYKTVHEHSWDRKADKCLRMNGQIKRVELRDCRSTNKIFCRNIDGSINQPKQYPYTYVWNSSLKLCPNKSIITSYRSVKALLSKPKGLKEYGIFWLNERMYSAVSTEVVSEKCQLLSKWPHRAINVRNCKMIGPVIFLCKKGAKEKHRCQWVEEKPKQFASTTKTEMPLSSQGNIAFPSLSSTESHTSSSESHSFKNTVHREESRNRNRNNFTEPIAIASVSVFIVFITVMVLVVYFNRKRAKNRSDTSTTPGVEFDTTRNVCNMRPTSGVICLTEPSEGRNMGSVPHLKGTQSKEHCPSLKTVHPSSTVEENDSRKNESMKSVPKPSHGTGYSVDNEASHYESRSMYHTLRVTRNHEHNENADYDHIREGMSYKYDNSGDTYSHVDKFNLDIESEQSDTYAHTDKDDTYAHTDKDDTYAHTDKDDTYAHTDKDDTYTHNDKDDTYAHTDKDDTYAHTDKDDTYTHTDKDDTYAHTDKDDTYAHTDKDDTYAHTDKDYTYAHTDKDDTYAHTDKDYTYAHTDKDDTYAHTDKDDTYSHTDKDDTYVHTDKDDTYAHTDKDDTYAHTSVLAVTSKGQIDDTYCHTENMKRL